MNEGIKVYVIFIGDDVYAYTCSKRLKDKFLSQRKNGLFQYGTTIMSQRKYEKFKAEHTKQRLLELPLTESISEEINVVMTSEEETKLGIMAYDIEDKMHEIASCLDDFSELRNKYKKSVMYLLKGIISRDKEGNPITTLNTLRIFFELFGNTVLG